MASNYTIYKLNMQAGNNFSDDEFDDDKLVEDTETFVIAYNELTAGGRIRFDDPRAHFLHQIFLDMGDATTWELALRTIDAAGNPQDQTIADETTEGGNQVLVHGKNLATIAKDDLLVLTSSGASNAMYAQVIAARWS